MILMNDNSSVARFPIAAKSSEERNKEQSVAIKADTKRKPLQSLGDIVFVRNKAKGVDVTALWCGDPLPGRSALDMARARMSKNYVEPEETRIDGLHWAFFNPY